MFYNTLLASHPTCGLLPDGFSYIDMVVGFPPKKQTQQDLSTKVKRIQFKQVNIGMTLGI